jgi:hypothetical protein
MSITLLISAFRQALENGTLVKLHLAGYRGPEDDLQSVLVRSVFLKDGPAAQFTYRHRKKDITKNTGPGEAPVIAAGWLNAGHFSQALLFTTKEDLHLDLQQLDKPRLYRKPPSTRQKPDDAHNRAKNRAVSASKKGWMQALGLVDEKGDVIKSAADKYRQINHFIAQVEPAFASLPSGSPVSVYDMGSGKGYLTFGLFEVLKKRFEDVSVTGIEAREDLVQLCNEVAATSGMQGLTFETGTIEDHAPGAVDMLVALHACDTATDDALWAGIQAGAAVIVAAPCCHKQVRREMEGKKHGVFAPVSRYGVFLEREAEMLTDALRALLLEYHGYTVKVLEFVSDAHTPKNVLLLATKKPVSDARKTEILDEIRGLKQTFGIGSQALEAKAGLG